MAEPGIACDICLGGLSCKHRQKAAAPCHANAPCRPQQPRTRLVYTDENWVAANKVGCDANMDPRLVSPVMQAPSFTGNDTGQFSELGASVQGNGADGNGTPAIGTNVRTTDGTRSAFVPCVLSISELYRKEHAFLHVFAFDFSVLCNCHS